LRIRYSTEDNGRPVKKAIVYTRDEHGISLADIDKEAVYITDRLRAAGYETYIVGGAVRDLILGEKPKDFDIVTGASPNRIKKIFRNARIIGHRFRLVHVFFGSRIFEVSTFRSLKDGPTSNTFGAVEEDVLRRDFTLNALFYDPQKQIVVDYVGGLKDIRRKKIKPIIPLEMIFSDDPVRMIRAVKYAAAAGFTLPLTLKWKIRQQSSLLAGVSHSRLTEEISKIIRSPKAAKIVEALEALGLYGYLQPEASKLFRQEKSFKERYLRSLAALGGEGFKNLPGEALSALVRDYLDLRLDWEGGGKSKSGDEPEEAKPQVEEAVFDAFKSAFFTARRFVLPMNPPRMELDHALRLIFTEHGISAKKSRLAHEKPGRGRESKHPGIHEKERTPLPGTEKPEGAVKPGAASPDSPAAKRRNRRRRKRPARALETGAGDAGGGEETAKS
jgi:poly(A) polymerase